MQATFHGSEEVRPLILAMIKQLLILKPSDPIPFIYSFLKQTQAGVEAPEMPSNLAVAEVRNLRKKYEYLKGQVIDDEGHTESSEEDESDEEEKEAKPVKRPIK